MNNLRSPSPLEHLDHIASACLVNEQHLSQPLGKLAFPISRSELSQVILEHSAIERKAAFWVQTV